MVCGVDDGVGRLMSTLRETGLERDTLIFFLSDNGGPTAVTHSNNHPLRGNKGQVYEGGVRVPFLMRWSGTLGAGKTYTQPVISLDIMATAAAAGGAQMPADRKIDGVNLLPHVAGKNAAPPHDRLYFRRGGGEGYAVRERRYKLVKEGDAPPQLFDLEKDIGETTDIGAAQPAVRERLLRAYEEWNRELIPPLFESPNHGKKKA